MSFLNWERKRAIAFFTIAIAGLAHINLFKINELISPLIDYTIVGEIKVITIIGIVTVILSWMLWKRRYIG